ncbi:MAG: leucine-rich repeat domain-containing protein [Clostridiales bacterium]|nr:leucine-rich repeat domain-containing protein [Clostridiales bacterium]
MKKQWLVLLACLCASMISACDFRWNKESSSEEVHTHEWDNGLITTQPTCEEKGVKTFSCDCGESYTEEVSALGHDYQNDTCLVCGYTRAVSQGLEYELNDDGMSYSVVGLGSCTDTDLVIPSAYNDLPVTCIGSEAFFECNSLINVEIGDSVTSVGDIAFALCDALRNVVIGKSLISIGEAPFGVCKSLISITVSKDNEAYQSIDGNLYSKDGKTLIQYATGKTDTSFIIPDSVTSIGSYAFPVCTSLTSVEIPNSVTSIGNWAFTGCTSLTSVEIPDSVTSIGTGAFEECSSLISVEIPDSVTSIAAHAFYSCTSLTSVVIPDLVTCIGDFAFASCDVLREVVIPNLVTSIGEGAFVDCPLLAMVYYNGTAEEWGKLSIRGGNNFKEVYYYSETEASGCWCYVDGVPTAW